MKSADPVTRGSMSRCAQERVAAGLRRPGRAHCFGDFEHWVNDVVEFAEALLSV